MPKVILADFLLALTSPFKDIVSSIQHVQSLFLDMWNIIARLTGRFTRRAAKISAHSDIDETVERVRKLARRRSHNLSQDEGP